VKGSLPRNRNVFWPLLSHELRGGHLTATAQAKQAKKN
jgi:hypothetical protein